MITSYEELSLGTYQDIDRICKSEVRDELEKQVAVLAILSGKPEVELMRMPLPDYTEMAGKSAFLRKPMESVPEVKKEYLLGGMCLRPVKDYRGLTAGQYIDFQAFTKDEPDWCGLLSVLLVPKGKVYGSGYDVAEVREAIAKEMPMPEGMALIAFFLKKYADLIRVSLTYSERELRRMKDKRKVEEIQGRIRKARSLLRIAGVG